MNPFLNPVTGLSFLKNFFFDYNRIRKYGPKQMEQYRDKSFKKLIKYAYTVPLYHDKYKKAGVHPQEIQGIKDITKLPLVTKKDLIDYYPNKTLPKRYNRNKVYITSTSGSTGKPLYFYVDFSVLTGTASAAHRTLDSFNINWKKSRIAHVGNFSSHKPDANFNEGIMDKANFLVSMDNVISINAFNPMKDIIKELSNFKPDMIYSYPTTYKHLAYYKKKGQGKDINPKILAVGAAVTDEYTRAYVENAFGCMIRNVYTSSEAAGDIASECEKGYWHVNYDYYHLEAIDENMEFVPPGKRGKLVITRLFGKATPIIRYTGMDDWVTIDYDFKCDCGLKSPIIKGGVEGRVSASVILPDGRMYPAASFGSVGSVLNKLKTQKVKQFQIIQKKKDEIDILIVIDDELKDTKPSNDVIFKKIKEVHQKKAGPGVKITVKEAKPEDLISYPGKPSPLVVSHVVQE